MKIPKMDFNNTENKRPLSDIAGVGRFIDSLLTEIEELFAGVGLLNELEPLCDEDPIRDDIPPPPRTVLQQVLESTYKPTHETHVTDYRVDACSESANNPRISSSTDPRPLVRFNYVGDYWLLPDGEQAQILIGTACEHVLRYDWPSTGSQNGCYCSGVARAAGKASAMRASILPNLDMPKRYISSYPL
jgi:hypothetical protein